MILYLILLIILLQALPMYIGKKYAPLPNTATGIWYEALKKPEFLPPPIVFTVVWTMLYALMGVSFFRILSLPYVARDNINILEWGYAAFITQYILTLIWPILFFKFHRLQFSFIVNMAIFILVILMTIVFHSFDRMAGFLLLPYWGWLAFANYLDFSIYQLNCIREKD